MIGVDEWRRLTRERKLFVPLFVVYEFNPTSHLARIRGGKDVSAHSS